MSVKLKRNRFVSSRQAHSSLSHRQETEMLCSPHVEAGNGNYAFWGHKLLFPLNKDRSHCAGLRQAFEESVFLIAENVQEFWKMQGFKAVVQSFFHYSLQ